MVEIPVCPHCHTPLIEVINYKGGGLLVRTSHVKVVPGTNSNDGLSATLFCKRCNQPMEMPSGWGEKLIDLFSGVRPKQAIGLNLSARKQV